jgi:CRP-like cAMP-binding protein
MDNTLVKYLARLRMFKGAPDNVLALIAEQADILTMNAGDVLIRQDAPSDSLFIIRTGWVKITTTTGAGEEVVLNQVGPGQVIGEMSLLDRKPRSNNVVVLTPAQILQIKYDTFLQVLNQHPILAITMMRSLSDRLRFANTYIGEVIVWTEQIAAGNYHFVEEQIEQTLSTIVDNSLSDRDRANAFLSAFFKMVEGVKNREEKLKRQVQRLTIQIDEAKRQQAVSEVTETEFFTKLKLTARKIRQQRGKNVKRQDEGHHD